MLDISIFKDRLSTSSRYVLAVAIFAVALVLRLALFAPQSGLPFLTFYPAMVIAFYFCGRGPGLLFVLLSAAAADYFFLPPYQSISLNEIATIGITTYLISASLIGMVVRQLQISTSKLEISDERYRTILEGQTEFISRFKPDGTLLYVNDAYCRLFGKSRESLIWHIWQPAALQDDISLINGKLNSLTPENPSATIEYRVAADNGVIRWIQSANRAFFDNEGHLLEIQSVGRDITERKQVEDKLQDSEELFRSIGASAQDGIILIDDAGLITFWNTAASRLFGYATNEVLGKELHPLLAPSRYLGDYQRGFTHFRQTGNGAAVGKTLELIALRRDGTEFPIELSLSALHIQGRWNSVGIVRDITERKKAEALLLENMRHTEQATNEWNQAFDAVRAPMFLHDREYRVIRCNRAYAERAGLPFKEIIGRVYWEVFPKGSGPLTSCMIEIGKPQQPVSEEEMTLNGGEIFVTRNFAAHDADGGYLFSVHIMEDITRRKSADTELRRLNRVLKTLSAGNHAMLHASNEVELMESVCEVITEAGIYALAWIGLARQDENKSIEPVAISGQYREYVEALQLTWDDQPSGRGPTGTAVRTGLTQTVHDFWNDPRMGPWHEAAMKCGFSSSIALPMKVNNETIGALTIYASELGAFNSQEVALLEEVASDLSFGIENLRTHTERDQAILGRQHYIERLRSSLEDALQAIATTLEMRDPYTAGHQRRVADLATAIARKMGLPEEQIHGIHLAGTVHDVGKISVPAEILSKPSRLNDLEFGLIKNHAQAGYDILKDIEFPWPIAQAVLQHHERLNGSGYPQGLKADQILLEAKILAVADVMEAMFSHRPYRPGLGREAALNEITRNRGVLYDTQVVDSCLELYKEGRYTMPT